MPHLAIWCRIEVESKVSIELKSTEQIFSFIQQLFLKKCIDFILYQDFNYWN